MKEKANQTEKAKRDLALLKQAVDEGSQQAWTELMKIYRDTIFFMLLKITGNPDDAEDLCIETFGKAFTHIHQYNDKYAFSTWLFKIASNHGIDFIRKKQKNVLSQEANEDIDEPEDKFQFMAEMVNPEEKFIKSQKLELVRQVLKHSSPGTAP